MSLCCGESAAFGQVRARLGAVTNVVAARNGVTGTFITGRVGTVLVNGDSVRTGARSAAAINFVDGSVHRLGELSEATIRPGRAIDVRLSQGTLLGEFRSPGRIVGHYAVAAVRGTRVMMVTNPGSNVVMNYDDGPGTHLVDVASASVQLFDGAVTTQANNTVTADSLIGSADTWTGARFHTGAGSQDAGDRRVLAFDPATGTLTLDGPPAGTGAATPFLLVRPFDGPVVVVRPGEQTTVLNGPGAVPSPPSPTPEASFAGGAEFPFFRDLVASQDIQNHLFDGLHQRFRSESYDLYTAAQGGSPLGLLAPGVQSGYGAPGGIPSGLGRSNRPASSGSTSGGPTSGSGVVVVGRAARVSRSSPVGPEADHFLSYRPEFSAAGYQGYGAPQLLGHAQEAAIYGDLFLRTGLRLGAIAGRSQALIDEAQLHYRREGIGDLQLGRFHWFPGPTTNNGMGRLISFTTADGLLWRLPTSGSMSAEAAYLSRIDPLQGPRESGYAGRIAFSVLQGQIGFNALAGSVERRRVALSFDGVIPVLPQRLEVYGEFGRDLLKEYLYTGGVYLPYLFNTYRVDLFVERSFRTNFGHDLSVGAYFPLPYRLTGLVTMDKFDGMGLRPGVGLMARV